MELSEAIKTIINRFGTKVLSTPQFVNMLDDLGAFHNESPASKSVIKGLLHSGLGELLYQLTVRRYNNWQNYVQKCVNDYIAKSGYKEDIINRITLQLLYSVGLITQRSNTYNSYQSGTYGNILQNPKQLLFAFKQEYITALSKLITITTDEYGHKYGYYSTDANTQLYVIKSKIRILAKEVGESDIDWWLENEKHKVEKNNRPTQAQIKYANDLLLSNLIRDYMALMEKGYITEYDEFGLVHAKFSPRFLSDLSTIENRIIIIGNKCKEDRRPWINKIKNDFLHSKSSPDSARMAILDQLKNDYASRLAKLDRTTKSGSIDISDTILRDTRRKIIYLGSLLGKNMEEWINLENEKVSKERELRLSKRRKRNSVIGVAAGIVLLIGGWQGISYVSSSEAREAFDTTMSSAKEEYAQGHLISALDLYQKAENGYNASFFSSSYKREAHGKAVEISDKIISEWEKRVKTLLQSNKIAQAKAITIALPSNLILEESSELKYKMLSEQIDNDLTAYTAEIIEELLNDIYVNQGKLSESGRVKLEEIINVVPDNYWLNFIKEKSR